MYRDILCVLCCQILYMCTQKDSNCLAPLFPHTFDFVLLLTCTCDPVHTAKDKPCAAHCSMLCTPLYISCSSFHFNLFSTSLLSGVHTLCAFFISYMWNCISSANIILNIVKTLFRALSSNPNK